MSSPLAVVLASVSALAGGVYRRSQLRRSAPAAEPLAEVVEKLSWEEQQL